MKQIYLVILACGLLALPSALLGEQQGDRTAPSDGVGYTSQDTSVLSGVPCGTPQPDRFSSEEDKPKGKCSCGIITGATVSGCTGTNQLDCEAQTCTYERRSLSTGEVIETGNQECVWTPFYPS